MTLRTDHLELAQDFEKQFYDAVEQTTPVEGSKGVIDQFFNEKIPEIIALAERLSADGFTFGEIVTLITYVSRSLKTNFDVFTQENIGNKLIIAREIIQFVVRKFYAGHSKIVDALTSDTLLDVLITLIYRLNVKGK